MKKKLFAWLTAAALLLAVLPAAASAADAAVKPSGPSGVIYSGGALLVCDARANTILSWDGASWTVAAGKTLANDQFGEPVGGYIDGDAASAQFDGPDSIAVWLDGYAVSDTGNNVVRYFAGGKVLTLCGTGSEGLSNGSAATAAFRGPTGLASDGKGNLYIADTGNNVIRCINKSGTVTTYAGTGAAGYADGTALSARFNGPTGLCWYNGALYVSDTGNQRIRVIKDGAVTTLAGAPTTYEDFSVWAGGYINGKISIARFSDPTGIAVGDDGTVYVADSGNAAIRAIANGAVSTADIGAPLLNPRGLAFSGGKLFVTDSFAGTVMTIVLGSKTASKFKDVPDGLWSHDAVVWAADRGIFSGVGGGLFDPDGTMTRGMFATVLGKLDLSVFPSEIINGSASFSDVASKAWYANSVAWAASNGVVSGVGGGLFAPGSAVTREQAAVMLHSWCSWVGLTLTDTGAKLTAFSDASQISAWAQEDVEWAVSVGLLAGTGGALNPTSPLTRAEAAQLMRTLSSMI